ncbi:MAG TPA: hypothetical protein GXZ47_05520 [Treponema sp.]|nr:hypothetical protein [Treponema sp.]
MQKDTGWVEQLSGELFWDTDQAKIDPTTHARWLLEKVLEKGRWNDWLLVRTHIGRERIVSLIDSLRLDPKTRNFLEIAL